MLKTLLAGTLLSTRIVTRVVQLDTEDMKTKQTRIE